MSNNKSKPIICEGVEYPSIRKWALHYSEILDLSYETLISRYKKIKDVDEIIKQGNNSRQPVECEGVTYKSISEWAGHYSKILNIPTKTLMERYRKYNDTELAINQKSTKQTIICEGIEYESISKWAKHYSEVLGVTPKGLISRLIKVCNGNADNAINYNFANGTTITCEGKTFPSINSWANHYSKKLGLTTECLKHRLTNICNYNADKVLTYKPNKGTTIICEGKEFETIQSWANYYGNLLGIKPKTLQERYRKYKDVEKALNYDRSKNNPGNKPLICEGVKYVSANEWARHYSKILNIPEKTLINRLSVVCNGNPEATIAYNKGNEIICESKIFSSVNEWAKYYSNKLNVNKNTLITRYRRHNGDADLAISLLRNPMSYGENYIAKILEDNNVDFIYNKSLKNIFKDYFGYTNKQLDEFCNLLKDNLASNGINCTSSYIKNCKYDFAIINDDDSMRFIEYDGEQHFKYIEAFFKSLEEYIYRCNCDVVKNNIPKEVDAILLRVGYFMLSKEYDVEGMILHFLDDKNIDFYRSGRYNPEMSNDAYVNMMEEYSEREEKKSCKDEKRNGEKLIEVANNHKNNTITKDITSISTI